jgi:hypothetical protein
VHAVIGLLLGLGVAAQSILVRHWGLIPASVIGLLAMIFASVTGTASRAPAPTPPRWPCPC